MKANICKDGEDWMLDLGISVSMTKPLTRELIVEWVMKAYNNVSVEVVFLGSMVPMFDLIVMKLTKYVSYITILNHIIEINYLFILILKYFIC